MRYMNLYVEVISDASNDDVRSAVTGLLAGMPLKAQDGRRIGEVVHAQATEGPSPTRQSGSPS